MATPPRGRTGPPPSTKKKPEAQDSDSEHEFVVRWISISAGALLVILYILAFSSPSITSILVDIGILSPSTVSRAMSIPGLYGAKISLLNLLVIIGLESMFLPWVWSAIRLHQYRVGKSKDVETKEK